MTMMMMRGLMSRRMEADPEAGRICTLAPAKPEEKTSRHEKNNKGPSLSFKSPTLSLSLSERKNLPNPCLYPYFIPFQLVSVSYGIPSQRREDTSRDCCMTSEAQTQAHRAVEL